jgi:hypothetical protein
MTAFSLYSCEEWTVPPELVEEWKSDSQLITVRTKFENGEIKKNRGNPETTGCAQVIKCGSIGKIFPDDPLSNKDVQLGSRREFSLNR